MSFWLIKFKRNDDTREKYVNKQMHKHVLVKVNQLCNTQTISGLTSLFHTPKQTKINHNIVWTGKLTKLNLHIELIKVELKQLFVSS